MSISLVWFRRTLRVDDHRALLEAASVSARVACVFVLDPAILSRPDTGQRRVAFLFDGLRALDDQLRRRGNYLIVRHGDPSVVLPQLAAELGANRAFWSQEVEPFGRDRDERVSAALTAQGVEVTTTHDLFLSEPGTIWTNAGTPYTVFTPYKRRWAELAFGAPEPAPESIPGPLDVHSEPLPTSSEPSLLAAGEVAALGLLDRFVAGPLARYDTQRDFPADEGTSRLSPYLKFGMVSVRRVYAEARRRRAELPLGERNGVDIFLSELAWRDFYAQILWHFPHVARSAFKPALDGVAWENNPTYLDAWKLGQTGYPFIDAAMRELNATGWMHNRARMAVASFLTKDLLCDWRLGEKYFMEKLLDGDQAANNGGWQWAAGTGTDAQPYFRIFNPVSQGEKFDPDGDYVKQWCPELRRVPRKYIHSPWILSPAEQGAVGCTIGRDYPARIVDHAVQRAKALAMYKRVAARENEE